MQVSGVALVGNEAARFIKIVWSVTFAIILGVFILSVVAFLLGYSPQAGR